MMKRSDFLRALGGISVAGFLSACTHSEKEDAEAKVSGKIDYYTCTMHPFVHSKTAGKCPVCSMDLVPVFRKDATAPVAIVDETHPFDISPQRLQEIGVTFSSVRRIQAQSKLRAPARVALDESGLVDINVKAGDGFVERLYADYEGKKVRKGEPLMFVLCAGWVEAETDYIRAYRAILQKPRMEPNNSFDLENQLARMRARIRVWDLSNDQIASLEKFALTTNEIDLRTGKGLDGQFQVLSPIDGYVYKKNVIQGMKFEAGQSLLQLADLSSVWIAAEFSEDQAPQLDLDQELEITFPYLPGQVFHSKISFLNPALNDATRRIEARLVLDNPGQKLLPGMYANVTGHVSAGEQLVVPVSAVIPTGDRNVVFLNHGNGRLEPRLIQIGVNVGNNYIVLSGLKEEDSVVSSANFLIDAESRVQGALQTWGASQ